MPKLSDILGKGGYTLNDLEAGRVPPAGAARLEREAIEAAERLCELMRRATGTGQRQNPGGLAGDGAA